MKRSKVFGMTLASLLMTALPTAAQEPSSSADEAGPPEASAASQAMDALDFMVGEWEGGGWIQTGPEQRFEFQGTETVTPKLGGEVILVEGSHTAEIPGRGRVPVHQALGVFSYDEADGDYRFATWVAGRGTGDSEARLAEDGALIWGFREEEQGADIRFTIRLTDGGAWHEIGERSTDGETWNKFFEMTMERVGETTADRD